jgi:hypothetical protein
MSQVVQARCPQCKNVLRIPAAWVHQPMRCKHCGQVFLAKAPPPPAAPVPVKVVAPVAPALVPVKVVAAAPPVKIVAPTPPAKPAPAPVAARPAARPVPVAAPYAPPPVVATPVAASNRSPFDFDGPAASGAIIVPRRPHSRGWMKGLAIGLGVLALAGVIGAVFGPQIADQFHGRTQPKRAKGADEVSSLDAPSKVAKDDAAQDTPKTNPDGGPKQDGNVGERPPVNPPKDGTKDPPNTDTTPPKADGGKKADSDRPKTDNTRPRDGTKVVKGPPKKPGDEPFPRRALFISVNDYLYANPLHFGAAPYRTFPGASTWAVRTLFGNLPLRVPNTQLVHLSDNGVDPHSPLKPVIERTLADFVNTCRAQDRIAVLFAGHVVELEKEAYLVPLEGDLTKPDTLIPLSWVYDRLKECRARQKVLILDVCRFDPTLGRERAGGEPMGKVLSARLQQPPPGVQVWASCALGQQAYELENGSVFLQALCTALMELRKSGGLQEPGSPLPLESLVGLVNAQMTRTLTPHKLTQTSRLTGKEAPGGSPPNPEEPPALVVRIEPPPTLGGAAPVAEVKSILDQMNRIPPVRSGRNNVFESRLDPARLPAFSAEKLDEFKADYPAAELEKSPFRAAIVKAIHALQENATKFKMRESFVGANSAQVKAKVRNEQTEPGKAKFYLKEALSDLREAAKLRDKEPSKRWQAHFDYVEARLLARLIYLSEYNYALAKIRTDSLPELPEGMTAYQLRLGSKEKVEVPRSESEWKGWMKELKRSWERIINQYRGTPWAVIARREQMTALGLEWRPARE